MFHHCHHNNWLTPTLTCERQCGAGHSHHSISCLTHIAAIVWWLKGINNKWWGSGHPTAGAPDADVGGVIDKSHSILCPGDGCFRWVCYAVQPDHRLLHNLVDPTVALEENIWESGDGQLGTVSWTWRRKEEADELALLQNSLMQHTAGHKAFQMHAVWSVLCPHSPSTIYYTNQWASLFACVWLYCSKTK